MTPGGLLAIPFQGWNVNPTRFHFENGTTLVIFPSNHTQVAATRLPFRQSFFAADRAPDRVWREAPTGA